MWARSILERVDFPREAGVVFGPSGGKRVHRLAPQALERHHFISPVPTLLTIPPNLTVTLHEFVFRSSAVGYLRSRAKGWAIG